MRCYTAATGQQRWSLDLAITGDIATADIDGDGVSEFIASAGSRICAIKGVGDQGKVAWSLDLGSSLSAPIIADIDGDGRVEVLVTTAEGYLCAIDQRGET